MGMPVCGHGSRAEITHVFTCVDWCVAGIKFVRCSVDDVLVCGKRVGKGPSLLHNVLEMRTWRMQAALCSLSLFSTDLLSFAYCLKILLCKFLKGKCQRLGLPPNKSVGQYRFIV